MVLEIDVGCVGHPTVGIVPGSAVGGDREGDLLGGGRVRGRKVGGTMVLAGGGG